jgi:type I restriction-modification system DNA methylase subunit
VPASNEADGVAQVRDLVLRFGRNIDHYRSAGFDEASTREYFINPLFEALGWDVRDLEGRGPQREVIYHQRIRSSASVAGLADWDDTLTAEELAAREPTSAVPDYAFQIDGTTRFFVEAKKPSIDLRQRGPSFQVKSYAWSQRVPFCVLTDFEEFRVFNSFTRPVYEEPNAGLVEGMNLTFSEYENAWPRMWELLSRESVANGSLSQLAIATTPRGAVPVDEAFLRELERWRTQLAEDLAARNQGLTAYELAEATQRVLDRLVFLRVCEDRGIQTDISLRRYARVTDSYKNMRIQFRHLDAIYNGQLFSEHFSERLEISDSVFQQIIAGLYFPAAYRFDAITGDLLGAIYERFLGEQVTVTTGQVAIEQKPEVRHAGGVYYTPRWIVEQVVDATLSPLVLDRRTPATPRSMANLRIIDPACGSGSFLIGALDWLVRWHEAYYDKHPDADSDKHYVSAGGRRRLTSDAKAEIVTNSLFGLDIDPQAVEVAQMNLYLRILEEETAASIAMQPRLFHGALLPSLASNVRSGNALLESDQVEQRLLHEESLRRRINPFDWKDHLWGFGRVFDERGGFDAVIGNPPYTRVQVLRQERPEEAAAYTATYESASLGSFDIASLFVERGLHILRPPGRDHRGGRLGFIISRQFIETDSGLPLRRLLREHITDIVDFGTGLVFTAGAYTLLLHANASINQNFRLVRVTPPPSSDALTAAEAPGSPFAARVAIDSLSDDPWPLSLPNEDALLSRLASRNPSLREVSGNSIFQGVVTGADDVFRAIEIGSDPSASHRRLVRPNSLALQAGPIPIEAELLRPIFSGKSSFRRFWVRPSNEWLILPYERSGDDVPYRLISPGRLEREFPYAFSWLTANKPLLEKRAGTWNEGNWYAYSRRQNLEKFGNCKIMVPYMLNELCAHLDTENHYFVNVSTGGYGVGLDPTYGLSPEYVSALLNSHLLSWVLRRYSRAWRGGWFGSRKGNLQRLPIVLADDPTQASIVSQYKHCCRLSADLNRERRHSRDELSARLFDAAVADFDRQIFDLYGLSAAEVKVVMSSGSGSE